MSETWEEEVTERNIRTALTIRSDSYSGEVCLFCREPERNYNPDKGIEFVCSNCVILLSSAGQEDLNSAHKKATEVNSLDQARALESFIEEEEIYVGETRKSERDLERERPVREARPSRHQFR